MRGTSFRSMFVAILVLAVIGAAAPGAHAATCGSNLGIVSSPDAATGNNLLFDVDARTAKDAWAVGSQPGGPLTEHWNGSAWSVVSTPAPTTAGLAGVAQVSATDIWAVGADATTTTAIHAIVLHHDGQAWTVVPDAAPAAGNSFLGGVEAVSSSDVWAVGQHTPADGPSQTLIEHWDGGGWSVVASPNKGTGSNFLARVAAISASDVWAEGEYVSSGGASRVLVEHWNGTAWKLVTARNAGSGGNFPRDIVALPNGTLWLVGFYDTNHGKTEHPLLERWNGHRWVLVTLHGVLGANRFLEAITAVSKKDVWALGGRNTGDTSRPFALHYDGTRWRKAGAEDPGTTGFFYGAGSAGKGLRSHVWGVGFTEPGGTSDATLIEEACGV